MMRSTSNLYLPSSSDFGLKTRPIVTTRKTASSVENTCNQILSPRKPPLIEHLDTTDIVNHVEGLKIATPVRVADTYQSLYHKPLTMMQFISVSSCFIWSLKNAIKESKKGRQIMMSVISTAELDPASVFYARSLIKRCVSADD